MASTSTIFRAFPPNATHVMVIRHGQTDRNAKGEQIQGWVDDKDAQLNVKGLLQADDLGKRLAERYSKVVTVIYSSPIGRCMQTSDAIAKHFKNVQIIPDARLKEICHGQHDTMSFKERNTICTDYYNKMIAKAQTQSPSTPLDRFIKWKVNPLAFRPIPPEREKEPFEGELETVFQVFERGTAFLKEIRKKHPGQTVLASSHAAWIKTMADEAEYREREDMRPLPAYYEPKSPTEPKSLLLPGNCSVAHFMVEEDEHVTFICSEDLENPKGLDLLRATFVDKSADRFAELSCEKYAGKSLQNTQKQKPHLIMGLIPVVGLAAMAFKFFSTRSKA